MGSAWDNGSSGTRAGIIIGAIAAALLVVVGITFLAWIPLVRQGKVIEEGKRRRARDEENLDTAPEVGIRPSSVGTTVGDAHEGYEMSRKD